jgi:lactoylglutathione lyase
MTSNTESFRLLHTMLRVKDLDASLDFYTNKLGMKLLRKTDFPSGEFTLAFVGYGDEESHAVVELTHNWGDHSYQLGDAFGHLAIAVPDVYKTCDELAAQGREDPAPGRTDEARWPQDRLHRGSGRLQDRAGRARLSARAHSAAVAGLVMSSMSCAAAWVESAPPATVTVGKANWMPLALKAFLINA